ncbi:MAG: CMGC/CDK/CDK7 protein kinase [Amphiamblys sp. WSBS2006]|nr:MAG: CMGC/CDK/CDK7 protein kinase [Amphiamblys sp. WSBS2006]
MSDIKQRYQPVKKIGEGTYAVVFLGIDTVTGNTVAIKTVKMTGQSAGVEISAVREIVFLSKIKHPNVVGLFDVRCSDGEVSLVLEYFSHNLEETIKNKNIVFSAGDIKAWLQMLLGTMAHCHSHWVLHRDLKPNNLLFNSDGVLKVADFGLAREYGLPGCKMTPRVASRWYRAPELLYGAAEYTGAADMWACGCIFAELLLRRPFLPGSTDINQLDTIFQALGTPRTADWPEMVDLPDYYPPQKREKPDLSTLFTAATLESLDLLNSLLALDPKKRITAEEALRHPYFSSRPHPTLPSKLPM